MPTPTNKKYVRWTEKFFECKKIAEEPALNREGFWKKRKHEELRIERANPQAK